MAKVQRNFLLHEEADQEVQELLANPKVQEFLATIRGNAGFGEIARRVWENGFPITKQQLLNNNN